MRIYARVAVIWVRALDGFSAPAPDAAMPSPMQVSCINRTHRSEPHERIRALGGFEPDGSRWKLREEQIIQEINASRHYFYIEQSPGFRVSVVVARHMGRQYLRTEADDLQPTSLLALPECPP